MAIVIDRVLALELLNVTERVLRMRARDTIAERFVRVEQDLFEAARDRHVLVCGEIVQQRGEAPSLAVTDVRAAADFYISKLGLRLAFTLHEFHCTNGVLIARSLLKARCDVQMPTSR